MKYQAVLPEHNDNVSHQNPLKEFFMLMLVLASMVLLAFWLLGFWVDMAVDFVSPDVEMGLFSEVMFLPEEADPIRVNQQQTLQRLLDQLQQCVDIPHPIKLQVVVSDDVNAFAYPGGHIVVYSGLLEQVTSENGLAFVLGHELGHIKNRDHLRALGRGLVMLALSASVTGGDSDISRFLTPSVALGQAQYSQARERLADETGLHILHCHYAHVGGATEFFEALTRRDQAYDMGVLHYFSSHPALEARIAQLHARSAALGYGVEATKGVPDDF